MLTILELKFNLFQVRRNLDQVKTILEALIKVFYCNN